MSPARVVCAATAVLALLTPGTALATRTAYVTSFSTPKVTPIPLDTLTPGTPISLAGNPQDLAFTPDGGTVYVTEHGTNRVDKITLATSAVAPVGGYTGNNPNGIAIDPAATKAYVANQLSDSLGVVNLATNLQTSQVAMGGHAYGPSFTLDGTTAFVGGDAGVKVLDTSTNTVTGTLLPGTPTVRTALTPDGTTLFANGNGNGLLYAIDVASQTVVSTISVPAGTAGVAMSPDGATVWAVGGGKLTPVDVATKAASTSLDIPNASTVAISPDSRTALVVDGPDNRIYPVDLTTMTIGSPITVSGFPWNVGFAPDQGPTAQVTGVSAAAGGAGATFDASGSSDPDGSVAKYGWDFGDGSTADVTTPTTTHAYPSAGGTFTATLTATDDEGCSTDFVYTGQSAACNGKAAAQVTQQVTAAGAATAAATDQTKTTVTLHGKVNPHGVATSYHFEYGTTTAYGTSTPSTSAGSGTTDQDVSAAISGLTPGTNYHVRLVADNPQASTDGGDMGFITVANDAPAAGTAGAITEFSTGIGAGSQPTGITGGPDGNVWFTEFTGNKIGRITPAGVVTEFSAGITPFAGLNGITTGPDGNLWFTELSGAIGRITPAGVVTEFPLAAGAKPLEVAAGPDGNVWFTDFGHDAIGKITPSGTITTFTGGITPGSGPNAITLGPDGNLWFTEQNTDTVGRITPAGVVTEFSAGITPGSSLFDIALGSDGNLWFTEGNGNRIGRITPAGVVTEFAGGIGAGGLPFGISAGPDGNLWFAEFQGDRIGRITPAGVVTQFSAGITPGNHPRYIAAGPDGNLWFTEPSADRVARIISGYTAPSSPTGGNSGGPGPDNSSDGSGDGSAGTTPATPPVLSHLTVSRRCVRSVTLKAPRSGTSGLSFGFRLSQDAMVSFRIARRAGSPAWAFCPRSGGHTPGTAKGVWSSRQQAAAGKRQSVLGTAAAHRRATRMRRGRRMLNLAHIASRRLSPGTYILYATARNAHGTSATVRVKFWVIG